MLREACGALLFLVLTATVGMAQPQGGFLDVFVTRVKPEKRAAFDAINKKFVDANRRHKGDTWLALETAYGEQNTVIFSSLRESYGDVEKSSAVFEGALVKAFGEAGSGALFQEFNNTLESSRTEIRLRRWDLSYNPPADRDAYIQAIGKSRWIRSVIVRVRPGHTSEFETGLKEINDAAQRSNMAGMRWVSMVTAGGNITTYHITRLMASLAELDQAPSMLKMLGEEGLQRYEKLNAEAVAGTEVVLYRILPELSNPPAEVVAVAPDFWSPKPKAAASPKPKAAEAGKPTANPNP